MQHSTNVYVHKHISKSTIFLGCAPSGLPLYTSSVLERTSDLPVRHLRASHVPDTVGAGTAGQAPPALGTGTVPTAQEVLRKHQQTERLLLMGFISMSYASSQIFKSSTI